MSLLAAGVLGHSLSFLAYGVFGQFTGQKQPDGGLDLARADSRFLVVVGKAGSFGGNALENVVNERVLDAHRVIYIWSFFVHMSYFMSSKSRVVKILYKPYRECA